MPKPEDDFAVTPAKPGRPVAVAGAPSVPTAPPAVQPIPVPKPVIESDEGDSDDGSESSVAKAAPQNQPVIETGPEEVIRQGKVVAHTNFLHQVDLLAEHYPLYAEAILKFKATLEIPGGKPKGKK